MNQQARHLAPKQRGKAIPTSGEWLRQAGLIVVTMTLTVGIVAWLIGLDIVGFLFPGDDPFTSCDLADPACLP